MSGRIGRLAGRRAWRLPIVLGLLVAGLWVAPAASAQSNEEVAELKRELAAKQAELERQRDALAGQRKELSRQQEELKRLAAALAALEARLDKEVAQGAGGDADGPGARTTRRQQSTLRDPVGDLNARAVAAGEFPGSILIPGTQQVSLAIGGFVKTVAIVDSDLEGAGPLFLPANIGANRLDTEGTTSLDASLSRVLLDARAPTSGGAVRGYIEVDLNGRNDGSLEVQLRHAYGSWRVGGGNLTAGHTWSTGMDLGVLPEGLTEPTVSGAIFQRQVQLRWSQEVTDRFSFDVALEDGTSSDATISGPWRASTRLPDFIAATEWDWGKAGHLRATGLFREIRVTNESGGSESAGAWGASLSGHLGIGESDKLAAGATLGEGGGRYLLGLPGGSAGFLDLSNGKLDLLRGAGAFVTHRHIWTAQLRSTAALGRAWVEDASWQAPEAFDSSTFGLVNLMWSPLYYVTVGAEYQYGARNTKDGSRRDNHRVILGVQIF